MACITSPWSAYYSEPLLSSDSSTIYSLFVYKASSVKYLYFASFASSSGNVLGTRYKSDYSVSSVYGSALNGNYLILYIK